MSSTATPRSVARLALFLLVLVGLSDHCAACQRRHCRRSHSVRAMASCPTNCGSPAGPTGCAAPMALSPQTHGSGPAAAEKTMRSPNAPARLVGPAPPPTGDLVARVVWEPASDVAGSDTPAVKDGYGIDDPRRLPMTTSGIPGAFFILAAPQWAIGQGRQVFRLKQDDDGKSSERPLITYRKGRMTPTAITATAGRSIEFKNDSPDDIMLQLDTQRKILKIPVPPFVAAEITNISAESVPQRLQIQGVAGAQCVFLATAYPGRTALADTDGFLRVPGLPAGEWRFHLLHDDGGMAQFLVNRVTRVGDRVKFSRGMFSVTIEPGENDIGEIGLSGDDLAREQWPFSLPWPFGS